MPKSSPKNLLIVDDDPGLLRLISRTLTREGYLCSTSLSGTAAIEALQHEAADLLLLDLKLQDTHAGALIESLESMGHHIPFIIITGQGDERAAVDMMKRGALDYVVKDTNFLEFLPTIVERALSQIKRERRLAVAETEVKENERRFRATLDMLLEGCQMLGFDWRYLYVNQAAADHGRRSMSDFLGRTLMEVYPGIETTPLFSRLADCMNKRTPCSLENRFYYSEKDYAWFQLFIQPVPEGLFILSLDITKRKEAEHCRKLLYDIAMILSENTSCEGAFQKVLERICKVFGWATGEAWMVDKVADRLRLAITWCNSGEGCQTKVPLGVRELARGEGIPGHVWLSDAPLFVDQLDGERSRYAIESNLQPRVTNAFAFPIPVRGEVLGVIVFYGDGPRPSDDLLSCFASIASGLAQFTERKKLEREIIEISHREQSRFGQDLHDGIGQQLTALEMFTVNLAAEADAISRPLGKKVRKLGEHLREAIRQTRAMANGLSPLSVNEGGLLTALRKLAEGTREIGGVDCRFVCPEAIEIGLDSAIHLYRIAQEATSNALKHGRAAKIRISLTRRAGGQIQLEIKDNGCGFTAEGAASGGMGLEVMKYRAGLIGADLHVKSKPGSGTRISCLMRRFI